jgi:hypothetical protein
MVTWQVSLSGLKIYRDGVLVAEIPRREFIHLIADLANALSFAMAAIATAPCSRVLVDNSIRSKARNACASLASSSAHFGHLISPHLVIALLPALASSA